MVRALIDCLVEFDCEKCALVKKSKSKMSDWCGTAGSSRGVVSGMGRGPSEKPQVNELDLPLNWNYWKKSYRAADDFIISCKPLSRISQNIRVNHRITRVKTDRKNCIRSQKVIAIYGKNSTQGGFASVCVCFRLCSVYWCLSTHLRGWCAMK